LHEYVVSDTAGVEIRKLRHDAVHLESLVVNATDQFSATAVVGDSCWDAFRGGEASSGGATSSGAGVSSFGGAASSGGDTPSSGAATESDDGATGSAEDATPAI
jgi:hypothetical protein